MRRHSVRMLHLLRFLLNLVLLVLFIPLILCVFLPLLIYKSIIRIFLSLRWSSWKYSLLTTNDSLVARTPVRKETIGDLVQCIELEGTLSVPELRAHFSETFSPAVINHRGSPYYRLTCRLQRFAGYLCTEEVGVDLEKQIYGLEWREGQDKHALISEWAASPYRDHALPRWEIALATDPKGLLSHLLIRVHHGLFDGLGILMLEHKLCGAEAELKAELVRGQENTPLSVFQRIEMWFKLPLEFLQFSWEVSRTWMAVPFSIPQGSGRRSKSPSYVTHNTLIQLPPLKLLRRKLDVSFNSLLYSLQIDALLDYLETVKGTAADNIPVLHSVVAETGHPWKLCNHFSVVRLNLPFSRISSPYARVKEVERIYSAFLDRKWQLYASEYVAALGNLFPASSLHPLNWPGPVSDFRLFLANVKFPSVHPELRVLGRKVRRIIPVQTAGCVAPNMALSTICLTRGEEIEVGCLGSSDLFRDREDLENYNLCFQKALERLEAAVIEEESSMALETIPSDNLV